MFFDRFVHERLRHGGIVDFAMPVPPVADKIDDHVRSKFVAVLGGDSRYADYGIHVFAIHMKNWNRLPPRQLRREARGMLLAAIGGESDQVVDDDVNRSAYRKTAHVGIVHGLRGNALAGEGGVPVHEDGQILFLSAHTGAVLFGASASHRDRINGFEVARVRGKMDMNLLSASRDVFAGRAHVILHVAGAEYAARVDIFKFREHFFGGAPGQMNYQIQAASVAHAHHKFNRAPLSGDVENLIHRGK